MDRFHREPSHYALFISWISMNLQARLVEKATADSLSILYLYRRLFQIFYFCLHCQSSNLSLWYSTFRFHVSTTPHRPLSNSEKKLFCGKNQGLKNRKNVFIVIRVFLQANVWFLHFPELFLM